MTGDSYYEIETQVVKYSNGDKNSQSVVMPVEKEEDFLSITNFY